MATKNDFLTTVSMGRVKPTDGMAVTADVWERAHSYHLQRARLHALVSHGSGIVAGLEVQPSDPADSSVYVLPGYAIDYLGREIIVAEPVSFDLGTAVGHLKLVLSYGEGDPKPEPVNGRVEEGAPYIVQEAFTIEVINSDQQTTGLVLATINRTAKSEPVIGTDEGQQPGPNSLDCRMARRIGAAKVRRVRVAVVAAGPDAPQDAGDGIVRLAKICNAHWPGISVTVDSHKSLDTTLTDYSMIYVIGHGDFGLSSEAMTAIYNALQAGVTLVLDRSVRVANHEAAGKTFDEMLQALGVELAQVPTSHELFSSPNLFSEVARGYDGTQAATARVGDGRVIAFDADYDAVWRGLSRQQPVPREHLRSAHEWGENLIHYVAGRKAE